HAPTLCLQLARELGQKRVGAMRRSVVHQRRNRQRKGGIVIHGSADRRSAPAGQIADVVTLYAPTAPRKPCRRHSAVCVWQGAKTNAIIFFFVAAPVILWRAACGSSSVGRAQPCQG